jgi:hypothetical protein
LRGVFGGTLCDQVFQLLAAAGPPPIKLRVTIYLKYFCKVTLNPLIANHLKYITFAFPIPISNAPRDSTQILVTNNYFVISADTYLSLRRSIINLRVGLPLMKCSINPLIKQ